MRKGETIAQVQQTEFDNTQINSIKSFISNTQFTTLVLDNRKSIAAVEDLEIPPFIMQLKPQW